MSMESKPHASQDFQSFNRPLIHQHLNTTGIYCHPDQQATHPFMQTMPSQSSAVVGAGAVQVSQENNLYPHWQHHPSNPEPVNHSLPVDTSSHKDQPASQHNVCSKTPIGYPPESLYRYQPIIREPYTVEHDQKLRFRSQEHGSIAGHNHSDVATKCAESDFVAMGRSGFEVPVYEGSAHPINFQTSMSLPPTSGNSQGFSISPETKAHSINFIRKLRQRERSNRGNWRYKEKKHGKRNQEDMEDDSCNLPPCKQFISEEKMAAKMSNLSITNDHKMATLQEKWLQAKMQAKRQLEEIESRFSDSESDDSESDNKEDGTNQQPSIHLSPELKAALSQKEGPLPDSIIKSMSNTCSQLVLWKPPTSYLRDVIASSSNHSYASKEDSNMNSCGNINQTTEEDSTSCTMDLEATSHHITPCEIARPIGSNIMASGPSADVTELFDSMNDDMDL